MLLDADFRFINEEFYAESVSPSQIDVLLADGWRHFGTHFFRYNLGIYEDEIRHVIPLRIHLADFHPSKSQRRVMRKNADLDTRIQLAKIDDETHALFASHKQRFKSGVPESIYDFLSREPARVPNTMLEVAIRLKGRLVAASFFDLGETSVSSVYAVFEPIEAARSLGVFTLLKELEYASLTGKQFCYQGYSYEGKSFYDYKKRFTGNQEFDWKGNWRPTAS
jgi:arginine-tRNA-protein transferase